MQKLVNSLPLSAAVFICVLLTGAGVYGMAENATYVDSLWWATVTASTVGYGDFYPVTLVGRLTGVVLSYSVILLLAPILINHILSSLVKDQHQFHHEEQEEIINRLRDIDQALERMAYWSGGETRRKEMAAILDTEDCKVNGGRD